MEKNCFVNKCQNKVFFKCPDCKNINYICELHLGTHATKFPKHNFNPIAFYLKPKEKSKKTNSIKSAQESILKYRNNLTKITTDLLKFIKTSFKICKISEMVSSVLTYLS